MVLQPRKGEPLLFYSIAAASLELVCYICYLYLGRLRDRTTAAYKLCPPY